MKHEPIAIDICERIRDAGGNPYIVGGWVRDYVMDRQAMDIDICVVDMTMEKLLETFPKGKQVGKNFPVVIVNDIEIALARTERKTGNSHTDFEVETRGVSLVEDLYRRDLTINAIALDPITGLVIDPFNGKKDIQNKILRPVSDAFVEDPLRVLRAARFAAQLDFSVSQELINMCQFLRSKLSALSQERIFEELMKALRSQKPSVFFQALDSFDCLEEVFPEIAALKGRIQPEKHHPEGCVFTHTMLVIDRAREHNADDETMFAALVHDLGKAVTPDNDLPRHINHEALGVPLVNKMCDRLKAPNSFRATACVTAREHLNIHKFLDLRPTTKVRLLERLGAIHGNDLIERVTLAAQADAQGRGPLFHSKPYPQRQAVLDAADKFRSVRGDQFSHLIGDKIVQKLERERAKLLS